MMDSATENTEHQDPLLNPAQLRQFVKNLPSKAKHKHDGYEHADSDTLMSEIEELFCNSDLNTVLQYAQSEYKKHFAEDDDNLQAQIEELQDRLECTSADQRISASGCLLYISMGKFKQVTQNSNDLLDTIIRNNKVLRQFHGLSCIYNVLQNVLSSHNITRHQGLSAKELAIYNQEVDLNATLLYLMIETYRQRPKDDNEALEYLTPTLPCFLFNTISQLREKYIKAFPIRKLILVLWKSLLTTFGGMGALAEAKESNNEQIRQVFDSKDDAAVKCTPQDYHTFEQEITSKYPTLTLSPLPFPVSSHCLIKAGPALASAMGVATATAQTELPYQSFFPQTPNSNVCVKYQQQQQQPLQPFTTLPHKSIALPLSSSGPSVPRSIVEASEIYLSNMHLSSANYDIIREREHAIHRWQHVYAGDYFDQTTEPSNPLLKTIDQFYGSVLPDLQNVVIVLLKVLLSTLTANNTPQSNESSRSSYSDGMSTDDNSQSLSPQLLEEMNTVRSREILSKAIASILFLTLKWFKRSHMLKFEYLSQLLVDSGCVLLILKLLGLQDITTLMSARTDRDEFCFFDRCSEESTTSTDSVPPNDASPLYTNKRNMSWAINFLRVLQMLTKGKPHRIMLLVQYKSSAVLKGILKISHPLLELYTLKIFKSQIPYLGRKWRSVNMKIISAIYLRCRTSLRDDWISRSDTEDSLEDGLAQETNIRILIRIYNGRKYVPDMLPPFDGDFNTNGFLQSYGVSAPDNSVNVLLDSQFSSDYEEWLKSDQCHQDDSPVNDDQSVASDRRWDIGTPIPSCLDDTQFLSPDLLAKEINKLYQEELNQEFRSDTPQLTEDSGWDSPTLLTNDDDQESEYGQDSQLDPLKGINWETLTEEELVDRLAKVEERTVQRWLAVDIDDPQYLKVLNAMEGLYIDSEAGEGGIVPVPGTEYDNNSSLA